MSDQGEGQACGAEAREQSRLAVAAARAAYQDTARLIRLLSILGTPGMPEDLMDETLTALSQVFQADVTCLVRRVDDRLLAAASCGLPEGDPAFTIGWSPSQAALEVLRTGRAATGVILEAAPDAAPDPDAVMQCGQDMRYRFGLRSAAWLPLPGDDGVVEHLLVLFRRRSQEFTTAEMSLLGSVSARLLMSVQARHRAVALELLARSGRMLSQQGEVPDLVAAAVPQLCELLAAERAVAFLITDRTARPAGTVPTAALPSRQDSLPGGSPWNLVEQPASSLPGWALVPDGEPRLIEVAQRGGVRQVIAVPVGPPGEPVAMLYAGWADLPPLMSPVTETAAIFANNLSAAAANRTLYRALSQSEASLRMITDSISDLIAVVDAACCFVYASASYLRTVDHVPDALVGRSLLDLVDPEQRTAVRDGVLSAVDTSSSTAIEYRLRTGAGNSIWVESVLHPVSTSDRSVVMSTRVIDERRRREDELRVRATQDPLTGLANRATATQRLEEVLAADRNGKVGVLFCDLNKFKQVNDRLGHAAGDDLLRQVAARLRHCTRGGDLVARLGGDEFVFVLDNVEGLDEVVEAGHRIARELSRPFRLAGVPVEVSISVGAAIGTRGQASATRMLESADVAMYAVKRRDGQLDPSDIAHVDN